MSGDVQGGTMLVESLAQYSALMVMRKKVGAAKMRKFLAYELDRYLIGRATEQKKELPLSRVENQAFIDLAEQVKEMTRYAKDHALTIAVMGCRVNGPGETDDADLGLWCGPNFVNLKRGSTELGQFPYDRILPRLRQELDTLIAQRQ